MKLPASLALCTALICATSLTLNDRDATAATIAVFGLMIWLSDLGSNFKHPQP